MLRIVNWLKRIIADRSNKKKVAYLTAGGARIGKGTLLNCGIRAFGTEPFLITIGSDCLIAAEVFFLTHDGGVDILNKCGYFGDKKMDKMGAIKLGDRVYVGQGAYIMPGVTIGNNVVIGAKSLVTKDIPDNSVAVGIPARVIKNIDEYYEGAVKKKQLYPTIGLSQEQKREYFENNGIANIQVK